MNIESNQAKRLMSIALAIAVLLFGFGAYKYYRLNQTLTLTKATLGDKIAALETSLSQTTLEKTSLSDALSAEQAKNAEFAEQIEEITGKVGTLEKLSKTDPELLKKYSKVYFLNENYEPKKLVKIASKYLADKNDEQYIISDVKPFLEEMQDGATADGLNLKVLSAYRSYGTQANLKSKYTVVYGAGTANQFAADQGYSEHQLGTAVDLTSPTTDPTLNGFDQSPEFAWLAKNAYKFGFVLSYPEKNTYYQYEPWHWRFVGTRLAKRLHNNNEYFYDLDQREIDKYLVSLFD